MPRLTPIWPATKVAGQSCGRLVLVGWVDDYRKLVLRNSKGLSAREKYFWQSCVGLTAALVLYMTAQDNIETSLIVPFFKRISMGKKDDRDS